MAQHSKHLAHHFDDSEQQFESSKLGMWLFLATEILLFGGLFVAYAVYRVNHPEIFAYAHHYLDKTLGGINTLVLICSSLTMAWAVRAAQLGKRDKAVVLLFITLLCAFGFMGIKFIEYKSKWEHGLLWGKNYTPEMQVAESAEQLEFPKVTHNGSEASLIAPAAPAPGGLAPESDEPASHAAEAAEHGKHQPPPGDSPRNVHIFFGIYFAMTGLHGLHVLAGMILISWLLIRTQRGDFGPEYYTPVDMVGLYWHLVDMIWIYLFPLLYLIS
jgi:cytochrome c oxidase subunit III